jgi:glucosamine kinase
MHGIVVGVDAGGSRTIAALARGKRVLRTFEGEGANVATRGVEDAAETIARCIERVLDGEHAAAIAVGAAGAGAAPTRERLRLQLGLRFPGARITLGHDAQMALRAVMPKGDAMVVVAGTGSIAYAEIGGRSFRAGGFGYLFGDAGSGFAIGSAALRCLLTALESGGIDDALVAELASHAGRSRSVILSRFCRGATPVREIAGCAPIVLSHAAAGHAVAGAIVDEAAAGLFKLVEIVAARCRRRGLPLAFAGGLLRERNALCARLEARIAEGALDVQLVEARREPYFGALSEARRSIS